jgi:hypothetical protein
VGADCPVGIEHKSPAARSEADRCIVSRPLTAVGRDMRTILVLIFASLASGVYAQNCPECTLADSCIREFSASVTKIRADAKKAEADFQKGMRELNLGKKGDDLAQRGTLSMRENMKFTVRLEIDALKECLGKIR